MLLSLGQDDCALDNDDLYTCGTENIARALYFTCMICHSSGVIGEPEWSEMLVLHPILQERQQYLRAGAETKRSHSPTIGS